MKRLVYTALAILVIIIAVVIAIAARGDGKNNFSDFTSLSSGETSNAELKKISVSEVTHSIFYAPQYVAMNLRIF